MGDDNQLEQLADFIMVAHLFVICPIGYVLDFWLVKKILNGSPGFTIEEIRNMTMIGYIGSIGLFIAIPVFHYYSYRYCKNKFGWFSKK